MKFYIDTSVFGGVFDDEFKEDTAAFFEYAKDNSAELIYSNITEAELEPAPRRVQELPKKIVELYKGTSIELVEMTDEAEVLAQNYLEKGILTEKCRDDARHIALATIDKVNAVVSWNFKHMVNFVNRRQYNLVNTKLGYINIDIISPKEIPL